MTLPLHFLPPNLKQWIAGVSLVKICHVLFKISVNKVSGHMHTGTRQKQNVWPHYMGLET